MKLAGLSKLFTMLYSDQMDIYRTRKDENNDSTTSITYQPEPMYKDVACRLSFNRSDTTPYSEVDRNSVVFNPKIFCSLDVDLLAGDYVVVHRIADDGSVTMLYEGMVAKPAKYPTHQEATIRINEGA